MDLTYADLPPWASPPRAPSRTVTSDCPNTRLGGASHTVTVWPATTVRATRCCRVQAVRPASRRRCCAPRAYAAWGASPGTRHYQKTCRSSVKRLSRSRLRPTGPAGQPVEGQRVNCQPPRPTNVSVDPAQPGREAVAGLTPTRGAVDDSPCRPRRWRRDDRQPDPRFRHTVHYGRWRTRPPQQHTRSRRDDSAPLGASVKAKPATRVDLRSSLDPDPSLALVHTQPGNSRKRSQPVGPSGLTRPRSFRDDLQETCGPYVAEWEPRLRSSGSDCHDQSDPKPVGPIVNRRPHDNTVDLPAHFRTGQSGRRGGVARWQHLTSAPRAGPRPFGGPALWAFGRPSVRLRAAWVTINCCVARLC
jgi:hypothetical protein